MKISNKFILAVIGMLLVGVAVVAPNMLLTSNGPGGALLEFDSIIPGEKTRGVEKTIEIQTLFELDYPRRMQENETVLVTLVVDSTYERVSVDNTSGARTKTGPYFDHKLDENSEIRLISSGFEIEPDAALKQKKGSLFPVQYVWTITPKREGKHKLIINLSGFIGEKSDDEERKSTLSVNGESVSEGNTNNIPLDVEVNTRWGVNSLWVSIAQGAITFLGFILMYPVISEKLSLVIKRRGNGGR